MKTAELREKLQNNGYFCSKELALVLTLAETLQKPILLEGPAGVGKTELGRAFAAATGRELIRLQCYEGLDERRALYEWNYQKQLLYLESQKNLSWEQGKADLFGSEFLLPRPILKAFLSEAPTVLLIDEIDKSDEEFESFLLEALADHAVTVPELGTVKAKTVPAVFLTSNGSRDFSDGLKRRCVHYYLDYPSPETEATILRHQFPELTADFAGEIAAFSQKLRRLSLSHTPGLAEVLDWAGCLCELGITSLRDSDLSATYHFLLKSREDLAKLLQTKE